MDDLKGDELVVVRVAAADEEERRVSPVHNLGIYGAPHVSPDGSAEFGSFPGNLTFVLQKIAHACASGQDQLRDVLDDLGFLSRREGREPFCKSLGLGEARSARGLAMNRDEG